MKVFTTGAVCKMLGLSRAQLLYREEVGHLPQARRASNDKRFYTARDVRRLRDILVRSPHVFLKDRGRRR